MLRPDEIQQINIIARQIAKEETGAMNTALNAQAKDLETRLTDLKTEMARVEATDLKLEAEIKDLKTELKKMEKQKESEKPASKSFSKK